MRSSCENECWIEHKMFEDVPDGFPSEISPEGLSLQRRRYLAKEIREFCSPDTRDLVCPIPEGTVI